MCCFVLNTEASKAKIMPNFEIFDPFLPVKMTGEWVKCLRQNEPQSSSLRVEVLVFQHVPPFRSHDTSKATGVENRAKISHFLTPLKLRGGCVKCLSELIKFKLGPNLLYTFAGSPLRGFGQNFSNG